MSECCASGSCEVCRPAAHGFPIQRREVAKWQREALAARAMGDWDRERFALDELAILERRFGTAIFEVFR